ncbi:MAG TPA: T9SS type A sorting domain-containing protein [Flavobacteriales bacterium]|nr:T9SS type A sorting domain-containing protein [Flavobacteriales bacterium]
MMEKILLALVFICIYMPVSSQTGPGGCGSSANNVLWLDANKGVTLVGGGVDLWNDQSGNGNNATPNGAAARPTFVSGAVNGFPAFDFDGTNDELWVPDAATLDVTQWHIFIVVKPDLLKNYNAWFVKGTDGQENFEMLSYSDGNIHSPTYYTDGTRTFPSSAASQVNTTTFEIIEYSYSAAVGRDIWKNNGAAAITTDNENKTPANNNNPVYIGNELGSTGRFANGDYAEIIMYNTPLNAAQKVIVNNYLAAKYNRALGVNDVYAGDNAGPGDFDYNVAGIGQSAAGSTNNSFSTSASAGLGITYVSGFDNGDYVLAGHKLVTNSTISTDIGVVSGGPLQHRWSRIWYIDVTNTSTSMLTNVVFDMSDGGSSATPGTASNYKLLYRATNSGNWTIVSTASSVAGDQITFSNVSFSGNTEDGYYTIGTLNTGASPLPIELTAFNAYLNVDEVDIAWTTLAEINNDYFSIERSKDGELWAEIARVKGAGNSNQQLDYFEVDNAPLKGTSYYRLKQIDFDGKFSHSKIVVVKNGNVSFNGDITPFPNPGDGNSFNLEFTGFSNEEVLIVVRDIQGRSYFSKVYVVNEHSNVVAVLLDQQLAAGTYLVVASTEDNLVSKRIVVK